MSGTGSTPGQRGQLIVRPVRTAVRLMLAYVLLCVVYIWGSDVVAARLARDVAHLKRIEVVKGEMFIVVTGAALFIFALIAFRRIARDELEIVRHRDALVESERRAMAGIFAASVAHDINNILTVIGCCLEELKGHPAGGVRERAAELDRGFDDLRRLAARLTSEGRRGIPGDFVETDLVQVTAEAVAFARGHASFKTCALEVAGEPSLWMRANPWMIRQMLLNLLLNAGDAAGPGGRVLVSVRREGLEALIEVNDSGPGVLKEKRNLIFQAFHTTKTNGAGLGLFSVKTYADAHRGSIEVTDSPLGGACFRVTLPVGL